MWQNKRKTSGKTKPENTHLVLKGKSVRLTSCFICSDLPALLTYVELETDLHVWLNLETGQTGGQPYSNTSPYKVNVCFPGFKNMQPKLPSPWGPPVRRPGGGSDFGPISVDAGDLACKSLVCRFDTLAEIEKYKMN